MLHAATISARIKSFLDYCRIEKGLAKNSIESYQLDLKRFLGYAESPAAVTATDETTLVQQYIDSLYAAGLASRSIARHLTTIRNFYQYLLQEGQAQTDPTSLLSAPRQWKTIPK